MKQKIIQIIAALILLLVQANAQSIQINSVDIAIEYALKHNPDLAIYELNRQKAKYEYNTVKFHWLPKASANFTGQVNEELAKTPLPGELFGHPGQTIEAQFGQKYNYNAGITVSKTVLDVQARFSSKIAQINVDMAEANEKVYKQKLSEQVAFYYYSYIVSKSALKVQQDDLQAADQTLELARQKFEQGIIDQYALNIARINKNNIQQTINSYKNIIDQCLLNLKILFGLSPENEIVFTETIDANKDYVYPVQEIGEDLSLNIYRLQTKQTAYKVKQQRAQLYPKLSLFGYWGAQQYRDDPGMSLDKNDRSNVTYWGINVSLPLFTGFATHYKIKSAQVEHELAMTTMKQEEEKSRLKDELLMKQYQNSAKTVLCAKDNFEIAKENADLSFQKYEQGLIGLDLYLDSFENYLKTEAAYLNALSDLYSYYATIISRNNNSKI